MSDETELDYVTVTTTTDSEDEAKRLATSAVESRLAACAQTSSPIASTYWWDDRVQTATEYRVEFKTKSALAVELTEHIKGAHSYDTPEVVVTPILSGNPAYLQWITTETRAF